MFLQHIHRAFLWIQLLPWTYQYSKNTHCKSLTSSLFRRNWFSSVLILLSWVSKSNILDWAALSLAVARSRVCSTYVQQQNNNLVKGLSMQEPNQLRRLCPAFSLFSFHSLGNFEKIHKYKKLLTCLLASSMAISSWRAKELHSRVFSSNRSWHWWIDSSRFAMTWRNSMFWALVVSSFLG